MALGATTIDPGCLAGRIVSDEEPIAGTRVVTGRPLHSGDGLERSLIVAIALLDQDASGRKRSQVDRSFVVDEVADKISVDAIAFLQSAVVGGCPPAFVGGNLRYVCAGSLGPVSWDGFASRGITSFVEEAKGGMQIRQVLPVNMCLMTGISRRRK